MSIGNKGEGLMLKVKENRRTSLASGDEVKKEGVCLCTEQSNEGRKDVLSPFHMIEMHHQRQRSFKIDLAAYRRYVTRSIECGEM